MTAWLGDDVDQQALHLFALVSDGILAATTIFLDSDRDRIGNVVANEQRLNEAFLALERAAHEELLAGKAVPPARARLLVVALQIAPELERTGDLVEHIARRGGYGLANSLSPESRGLVERMGTLASAMWRDAAEAYADRAPAAAELRERDDELDDLHVTLTAQLAREPLSVAAAIEVGLVARFLERLGDHAVNVARRLQDLPAA